MIRKYFVISLVTILSPIVKSGTLEKPLLNKELTGVSVLSDINNVRSISCIAEDHEGYIWMSTLTAGLIRYNGKNYVLFSASSAPGSISANVVNTVFVDSQGEVWAGTQKGVNHYLRSSNSFELYEMDDINNYVTNIFEDSKGRILAATRRCLFLLDKSTNTFLKKISFENATNARIIIDDKDDLWLTDDTSIRHYNFNFELVDTFEAPMPIISAVFDGLKSIYLLSFPGMCRFDIDSLTYCEIPPSLNDIDIINTQYMNNLGNNMIVWVTSRGHYCYNFITDKLYTDHDFGFPYKVPQNISVKYIFKDSGDNIWFVTGTGYLKSHTVNHEMNPDHVLTDYLEGKDIGRTATNGRYFWIITDRKNLTTYDMVNKSIKVDDIGTLIKRKIGDNKIINLHFTRDDRFMLSMDNNVYEFSVRNDSLEFEHFYISNMLSPYLLMVVDDSGTLWSGGANDNIQYSPYNSFDKRIIRFKDFNINNETTQVQVSAMGKLKNGNIIIAYSDLGIVIINPQTMIYRNIRFPEQFKQMFAYNIFEDKEGRVWLGTSDIGLFVYDPTNDQIEQIKMFDGLNIKSITEDLSGQLLILCESTLYKLNAISNQFEPIWTDNSELPQDIDLLSLPNGNIILKTSGRSFSFSLAATVQKNILSKIDIIVTNGKNVVDIIEHDEMDSGKAELVLPSRQNEISVFLSNLSFEEYDHINYSYKIGAKRSNEWTQLLNNPELQFHYLSYGNNRIQLRVEPILKTTESRLYNLNIKVLRPWYLSLAAKVFYMIFIFSVCITILSLIRNINNKRIEAEIAIKEKDIQEKLNIANIDFFANISHEFRNPLTIISGAANLLRRDGSFSPQQARLSRIMSRNANRMLKLVSQLLDFNKLEHEKLQLNAEIGDAANLINEISEDFTFSADQRGIEISVVGCETPILVWMDRDKIEKVMYNLLSNALKFSPPGGKIIINVQEVDASYTSNFFGIDIKKTVSNGYLMVSVMDQGIGIPQENMQNIFERFGHVRSLNSISGTGIGLYFAKSMIEIHHGFIKAQNKTNDINPPETGAIFTFAVPIDLMAYSNFEIAGKEEKKLRMDRESHPRETLIQPSDEKKLTNTILIIDDDYEIVYYLKSLFSQKSNTLVSYDAMSGYNLIEKEHPDIIISDISMLGMDGLQLCRMVKENISMCHIPFILLTARSTVEDQIAGLDSGADAYVVKPFDPEYLFATIRSMLKNRDNVRHSLENNTKIEDDKGFTMSKRDRIFIEKLYKIMEEDISNPELNIERISEELCVSRTKLYYKLKSLTGKTPNEFFKIYKLNRAIELIKEGEYKISSIAEMVGFSSPSHFAASFKKHFGSLPSHYSKDA